MEQLDFVHPTKEDSWFMQSSHPTLGHFSTETCLSGYGSYSFCDGFPSENGCESFPNHKPFEKTNDSDTMNLCYDTLPNELFKKKTTRSWNGYHESDNKSCKGQAFDSTDMSVSAMSVTERAPIFGSPMIWEKEKEKEKERNNGEKVEHDSLVGRMPEIQRETSNFRATSNQCHSHFCPVPTTQSKQNHCGCNCSCACGGSWQYQTTQGSPHKNCWNGMSTGHTNSAPLRFPDAYNNAHPRPWFKSDKASRHSQPPPAIPKSMKWLDGGMLLKDMPKWNSLESKNNQLLIPGETELFWVMATLTSNAKCCTHCHQLNDRVVRCTKWPPCERAYCELCLDNLNILSSKDIIDAQSKLKQSPLLSKELLQAGFFCCPHCADC